MASSLADVRDVPLRQAPDLSEAKVNLSAMLDIAREGLFALLDGVPVSWHG